MLKDNILKKKVFLARGKAFIKILINKEEI